MVYLVDNYYMGNVQPDLSQDRLDFIKTKQKMAIGKNDETPSGSSPRRPIFPNKKINNINDFLSLIKHKMQDQRQHDRDESDQVNEVRVNMKFDNAKIELEKYRNIVQRQLSKTHSIQEFNIQQKGNRSQVIVKYDKTPLSEERKIYGRNKIKCEINNQQTLSNILKARKIYQQIHNRMENMTRMVDSYENNKKYQPAVNNNTIVQNEEFDQTMKFQTKSDNVRSKRQHSTLRKQNTFVQSQRFPSRNANEGEAVRVQRISNLFGAIQSIHTNQQNLQKEIKKYIDDDKDDDSSIIDLKQQ